MRGVKVRQFLQGSYLRHRAFQLTLARTYQLIDLLLHTGSLWPILASALFIEVEVRGKGLQAPIFDRAADGKVIQALELVARKA